MWLEVDFGGGKNGHGGVPTPDLKDLCRMRKIVPGSTCNRDDLGQGIAPGFSGFGLDGV
jgi:hypothetical protein